MVDRPQGSHATASQVAEVAQRADAVRAQIAAAGGDPQQVTLVAVTKGFGSWAIEAASLAGLDHVGENYAQELDAKATALGSDLVDRVTVHFIGGLQTNKVRQLASIVNVYQSVDRPALVTELAKRAPQAEVLLQLNVTDASAQGGCALNEADDLLERASGAGLVVRGAMAIGSAEGDTQASVSAFSRLVDFCDRHQLPERSIGMSGDLAAAVSAGSTMVRVGTALFGQRPKAA